MLMCAELFAKDLHRSTRMTNEVVKAIEATLLRFDATWLANGAALKICLLVAKLGQ